MNILEVIRRKGSEVLSVSPQASIGELVELLHQKNIGALVCLDREELVGIVSERDVMHGLAKMGADLLAQPVSSIMTTDVETCEPTDKLESLAERMTQLRIRHLPVVEDGKLKAIVSIGDVVKQRLEDLQAERDNLIDYMTS
ncbi:MAG TPA: CBS domain-containing protein [Beutenbergiaceae bacterium]|nr:CBS domain-containing protein [Beutenbergiaceae bacterium]